MPGEPAHHARSTGRSAALAAAGEAGLALPASPRCSSRAGAAARAAPALRETIPAPDNPVRWPLSQANPMIKSDSLPARGSTLRVYNYSDYISPRFLKENSRAVATFRHPGSRHLTTPTSHQDHL